jgi:hypothetical protein
MSDLWTACVAGVKAGATGYERRVNPIASYANMARFDVLSAIRLLEITGTKLVSCDVEDE